MPRILACLALLLLLSPLRADANPCGYCEGRDLRELVWFSSHIDTGPMRRQIRGWLAKNGGDTAEGHYARGWIANQNDADVEEVMAHYRKSLAVDPTFSFPANGLFHKLRDLDRPQEGLEVLQKVLPHGDQNNFVAYNLYRTLRDDLKDADAAQAFLAQARATGSVHPWILDWIEAFDAWSAGDYEQADMLFKRSLKTGGSATVYSDWLRMRGQKLDQDRASEKTRQAFLREAYNVANQTQLPRAFNKLGQYLRDDLKYASLALQVFEESWRVSPTVEAAIGVIGSSGEGIFPRALPLFEAGLKRFPDNTEMLSLATVIWSEIAFDPEKARAYGQRAIETAATNTERQTAIRDNLFFLEQITDFDEGARLIETHMPQMDRDNRIELLSFYIDNRIAAKDFSHAARLIEQAEPDFSAAWLDGRRYRLASAIQLAESRDRYFEENPFLADWERKFGESLRVSVEFDTGKATLRPEGRRVLDQAASALTAPGAEDYVFLIEGHTDSTGTDDVNLPLSRDRAGAVEGYFSEHAGIAAERLQTVGFGPRIPAATNATDGGRQINRRVEIRPWGSIAAPQIVTNGWVAAEDLRLSPDGRTAVVGSNPMQVWDLQRMVRLHELPLGDGTREISPNGRYVAAASSFADAAGTETHRLIIYDLRTGLPHSSLILNWAPYDLSWSPFSEELAWIDDAGNIDIYNLRDRRKRDTFRAHTNRISGQLFWSRDGREISVAPAQSDFLTIFDATTLDPKTTYRNTGWLHSLMETPDGKYLVATDNKYNVVAWDKGTGQEVLRQRLPMGGWGARMHPTQPWIMVVDSFTNQTKLMLVEIPSGQVLASHTGPKTVEMPGGFTPDGSRFLTAYHDEIVYFDTATLKPVARQTGHAVRGHDLTKIPDTDLMVSRDDRGSGVWNLGNGRRVHRIDVAVTLPWQSFSADGRTLINADPSGKIVLFDSATFRVETAAQVAGRVSDLVVNDRYVALALMPEGDGAMRAPQATLVVLDRIDFSEVMRVPYAIVTEPLRYGGLVYRPKAHMAISDAEALAIVTSWQDGFGHEMTDGKYLSIFDIASQTETLGLSMERRFNGDLRWDDTEAGFWFHGAGRRYLVRPDDKNWSKSRNARLNREIPLQDGRVLTWLENHMTLDGQSLAFNYNLSDVELHEARNLAVGITDGNEIVFVNLADMTLALTIAPKADGEWIAFAPTGEYSASLNGTTGVYWSLGDNYLPFEALAQKYARPDVVRRRLDAVAQGTKQAGEDRDVAPDLFEAPYTVTLGSEANSSTESDSYMLKLAVEKASADLPDPEIEYRLNGRRILKSRGFDEDVFFTDTETVSFSRRFALKPGDNVIEASLLWKGARLQTQRVKVRRTSLSDTEKNVTGRTLWFFGVGVSDYEISSQNLNFAHRDAEELERLLKDKGGALYDRVETRILTNANATERAIRVEMNEFLSASQPDDVVVVFIAGHGVTDEDESLYFLTHEADMSRPYTGMAVDRFRQYLERRPINQTALLLLDICHSGALEGRVVADDAVQELSAGTGAIVFASSQGSQQSLEDESFGGGHGAFTAALLDALRGTADTTVGNQDGFNSLKEIILYTASEVPRITAGNQQPTIPRVTDSADHAITRTQ
ncbi:MAG: caspase family protein [Pelagimonas sp.]|nr:caspase family protein [Pelagimonas sp.]